MPTKGLPCTVVSVGNLTVGGTGKTPTTLWLAEELARRGYRVAILSRGYKRTGWGPVVLDSGLGRSISIEKAEDSLSVGDEPLMMAAAYGQRVGVGRRRSEVANLLLSGTEVDVFLLDDGFQYRRLRRDLDLLLLGLDWNGWLIPAGPFREPRSALSRAHLHLITGSKEKWKAILARGRGKSDSFFGSLRPKALLTRDGDRWTELPLSLLSHTRVLAVCTIANPASFYRMIQEWEGEIVDAVEFPDHHRYSTKDWQTINRVGRDAERIITTEKDIVKLLRFPFAKGRLLALRVSMVVERGDALVKTVEETIRARRGGLGDCRGAHG